MALPVRQSRTELANPSGTPVGGRGKLPFILAGVLALILAEYILRVLSMPGQWVPLLLLATLVFCATVVIGNTRKLLLVAILLGVPFSININLLYQDEMAALNAVGGLYISLTTVALFVLYALWVVDAIAKNESGARFLSLVRSDASLTVYVAIVALSAIFAGDRTLGSFEAFRLIQFFLLYIYLRHAVRTRQDAKFVVTLLLVGMLVEAMVMLALPVVGDDVTIMSIRARIDGSGRVGGTIGGPNSAAAFMTLLIAPALGLLLSRVQRGYKLLGLACVFLGGAALVLTLSRGGWIGFGVSAGVFGFFALRRRWLPPITVVGLVVGAILVVLVFQDLILTRLTASDDGAAFARWPLMKIAAGMIADQPLLGVGANNFALNIGEYAVGPLAAEWLSTVHNRYLLLWAESGFFALLFYLAFLATTVRRAWRSYCRNDAALSPLALGLMAGVLGFMTHMSVDLLRSGPPAELFWIVAALIAVIDRMSQSADVEGSRL